MDNRIHDGKDRLCLKTAVFFPYQEDPSERLFWVISQSASVANRDKFIL